MSILVQSQKWLTWHTFLYRVPYVLFYQKWLTWHTFLYSDLCSILPKMAQIASIVHHYWVDFVPLLNEHVFYHRHMDEMIASFTECTPKHHHEGSYTPISPLPLTPRHRNIPQQQQSPSAFNGTPPTPRSYTPISPLPPTPQHRNIPQQQQSPLVLNGNSLTPGGHSTPQPSPVLAQRRQWRTKRPRVICSPAVVPVSYTHLTLPTIYSV